MYERDTRIIKNPRLVFKTLKLIDKLYNRDVKDRLLGTRFASFSRDFAQCLNIMLNSIKIESNRAPKNNRKKKVNLNKLEKKDDLEQRNISISSRLHDISEFFNDKAIRPGYPPNAPIDFKLKEKKKKNRRKLKKEVYDDFNDYENH